MKRRMFGRNAILFLLSALALFFRHPSHPPTEANAIAAIVCAGIALIFGFGWALTEPPPRRRTTSARQ